jgi:hypothetical protein
MRVAQLIAVILAVCCAASEVSAYCRDARKTCGLATLCLSNNAYSSRIRSGSGQAIWDGLNSCASAGYVDLETGRSFDDIAAGCEPGDYQSVTNAAILRFGGDMGACNALPE